MRLKKCKHCGKNFSTDREGAYLCPDCADKARREGVIRERTCTICGATFDGYPNALYCPRCGQEQERERARKYRQQGYNRQLGSIDYCQRCGAEYTVCSGLQKYCKDCADIAIKERSRARKRAYNADNKEFLAAHKKAMRADSKVCVICGKTFSGRGVSVTCSDECARQQTSRHWRNADIKRGRRKSLDPAHRLPEQSGIVGITWDKKSNKWRVKIKKKYFGQYADLEDAKAALEKAKSEIRDNPEQQN